MAQRYEPFAFLISASWIDCCNTLCYTLTMRNIINISVPEMLRKDIEFEVKVGGYASTSEFFRDILRDWKRNNLLKELQQSQAEIAAGKGKVLRSLKDLR